MGFGRAQEHHIEGTNQNLSPKFTGKHKERAPFHNAPGGIMAEQNNNSCTGCPPCKNAAGCIVKDEDTE